MDGQKRRQVPCFHCTVYRVVCVQVHPHKCCRPRVFVSGKVGKVGQQRVATGVPSVSRQSGTKLARPLSCAHPEGLRPPWLLLSPPARSPSPQATPIPSQSIPIVERVRISPPVLCDGGSAWDLLAIPPLLLPQQAYHSFRWFTPPAVCY